VYVLIKEGLYYCLANGRENESYFSFMIGAGAKPRFILMI